MVSYARLLELFWQSHAPTRPPWSSQYRSAVFFANDAQRRAAEEVKAAREARTGRPLFTEVAPLERFWLAEDYHQKYHLTHQPELMAEFEGYDGRAFVDSTVAARLNGFVGGDGTGHLLREELPKYGLSAAAQARVEMLFNRAA